MLIADSEKKGCSHQDAEEELPQMSNVKSTTGAEGERAQNASNHVDPPAAPLTTSLSGPSAVRARAEASPPSQTRVQSNASVVVVPTGPTKHSRVGGVWDTLKLSFTYASADARRRPRNTIIGIIAVFIMVFFSGVVILGIWKMPYILLRLAELNVGEVDVDLHGTWSTATINFSAALPKLQQSPAVHGAVPRWIARSALEPEGSPVAESVVGDGAPAPVPVTGTNILIVDTALETAAGIGRGWPYRQIGYGESQVYYSAAEYIGVRPNVGDRLSLVFQIKELASLLGLSNFTNVTVQRPSTATDPLSFYLRAFFALNNISGDSVRVVDLIDGQVAVTMTDSIAGSYGKYSSSLGNVVVLDYKHLLRLLVDESCAFGSPATRSKSGIYFPTLADLLGVSAGSLNSIHLADYALSVCTTLKDRYTMYYAGTDERNAKMVAKSNSLMIALGIDADVDLQFPLMASMASFDTFKALLVAAFITVVASLVVLGSILMFTLLRINADERQFELAMIRAQGMRRTQVAGVLTAQTLAFTVPGTALGVVGVFLVNVILEVALTAFTVAPAHPWDMPAVVGVTCTLLGLLLPLVATWSPVQRALGGSLRDALDIYRQVHSETHVMIVKLEELGLETWQVLLGLFLVLAGFMVYYLMPLAFLFNNLMIFFVLLDVILMFMVAGLCMMLSVLEPFAEALFLRLLLWGRERRLLTLITKNLKSHRERNSQAHIMFLLSVGSLTFAGIIFTMLSTVSVQLSQIVTGAEVTVTAVSFNTPLDHSQLDAFLSTEGSPFAQSWAYGSFSLNSYPQVVKNTRVANFIGTSRGLGVNAISSSFLDATYPSYNMIHSYDTAYEYALLPDGKPDVVRSMYASAPQNISVLPEVRRQLATGLPSNEPPPSLAYKKLTVIPALISSASEDQLGVGLHAVAQLTYRYALDNSAHVGTSFLVEPRALMNRVSGFFAISAMPVLFSAGTLLIPASSFQQLLNPIEHDFADPDAVHLSSDAVTTIRQQRLFVKLHSNVSKKQREAFVNALQAHTNTAQHITVDAISIAEEFDAVRRLIMYFFYFSAVICIILCAFMMWIVFISNVQLHAWTYGVLRSLGFRNAQLMRSAIYEALCIVLSAFLFGLIVGLLVGLTLALQLSSFIVLPFQYNIPYVLILVVLGMALSAAVIGSSLPFFRLRKIAISSVLKGV